MSDVYSPEQFVDWRNTHYIRADVAQAQLDAARADAIDERNRQAAYIAHLQQRIAERDARIAELEAAPQPAET